MSQLTLSFAFDNRGLFVRFHDANGVMRIHRLDVADCLHIGFDFQQLALRMQARTISYFYADDALTVDADREFVAMLPGGDECP